MPVRPRAHAARDGCAIDVHVEGRHVDANQEPLLGHLRHSQQLEQRDLAALLDRDRHLTALHGLRVDDEAVRRRHDALASGSTLRITEEEDKAPEDEQRPERDDAGNRGQSCCGVGH